MKRIIVGVDGSESSIQAVEFGGRLARETGADLTVVGARGQGPIGRLLGASVSTRVVHHADRPVLVVR